MSFLWISKNFVRKFRKLFYRNPEDFPLVMSMHFLWKSQRLFNGNLEKNPIFAELKKPSYTFCACDLFWMTKFSPDSQLNASCCRQIFQSLIKKYLHPVYIFAANCYIKIMFTWFCSTSFCTTLLSRFSQWVQLPLNNGISRNIYSENLQWKTLGRFHEKWCRFCYAWLILFDNWPVITII